MGIDAEMFVRIRGAVPDAKVRLLRTRMVSAFGADRFWIFRDDAHPDRPAPIDHQEEWPPQHAMERVAVYEQDGPDIVPEPGETFLRVYPATRYYGVGYERGDLGFLCNLASWLEAATGGVVWYGGDSSGVTAKPFGPAERAALWDYFCTKGHDPYRAEWGALGDAHDSTPMLCTFCEVPMTRNGWGQTYVGYDCYGCGERLESRDNGVTFTRKRDREKNHE